MQFIAMIAGSEVEHSTSKLYPIIIEHHSVNSKDRPIMQTPDALQRFAIDE